jgi:hypothetical protein
MDNDDDALDRTGCRVDTRYTALPKVCESPNSIKWFA